MTTETFITAGQNTWVAPAGVSTVQVELWGGGAGGGGNNAASDGGGGGSGSGYGRLDTYTVAEGSSYTYFVGTQGLGVLQLSGTGGSVTWWRSAATFAVPGGVLGTLASGGTPGAGGVAVLTGDAGFVGTFTLKTSGGNGGTGRNNANGTGGGGGGSGGNTTAGGAGGAGGASGGTAGAAGTTNGGIGAVGAGIGAGNGLTPGSGNGGAGSGSAAGTDLKGGDGTVGKIILNYTAVGGVRVKMDHYNKMAAA